MVCGESGQLGVNALWLVVEVTGQGTENAFNHNTMEQTVRVLAKRQKSAMSTLVLVCYNDGLNP